MKDQLITDTLRKYIKNHKDNYFIIGGNAVNYVLSEYGLSFRVTDDFDIVLVTGINDESFNSDLEKLLIEGRYIHKWKNEKATAYRFEGSTLRGYPKTIEFFIEEGYYPESLDKRLAKLDIKVNEEKISAITIDSELYHFALDNRVSIDGLMFLNREALIVLKIIAYFENEKLYKDNHKVDKNDYLKHRKDVIALLSSYSGNESIIINYPNKYKEYIIQFENILNSNDSSKVCSSYGVNNRIIVDLYHRLFNL